MALKRRILIQIICIGFISLCYGKVQTSESNEKIPDFGTSIDYPFQNLNDAFHALDFEPTEKGNSFFVITADVHYGSQADGMLPVINEVNKMFPTPDFFCVNGDMIVNGSLSFGRIPTPEGRQAAINEFRAFKKDAENLNRKIKLILTLGNHDTHPKEVDPEMFWEVFPDHPPYQSFNLSGVQIIVLNGGSCGYIDEKQMEWLLNDVNEIPKDQTVIVLIHQPSMAHRTRERGIPEAISEAFTKHKGMVWLIGGHGHTNRQRVFQLQKTKLVQHGITTGVHSMWGGPERPGYWVYCLQNGKVIGRIFRKLETGYRIEVEPDFSNAEKVPMPFDHLDNIVWKVFTGSIEEKKYFINTNGRHCANWWAYVSELTYRLPLKETGNNCTQFAMLCDYRATEEQLNQGGQYFLSLDQKNWKEIELENAEFETLSFLIPEGFRNAENVFFKFTSSDGMEMHVGGFALF